MWQFPERSSQWITKEYLGNVINVLISRLKIIVKAELNRGKEPAPKKIISSLETYFVLLYTQVTVEKSSFFQTKANTTLFSRKMQNYSRFPQGLESVCSVPLLHWRSRTEIMNGPHSPLMVSSGHQRQKILQEGNLLCLAGNLPPSLWREQ